MQSWFWQSDQGCMYLCCSLLADWHHGFFSRDVWPKVPQDLVHALHSEAEVIRVKQVHGNQVLHASEVRFAMKYLLSPSEDGTAQYPEADGAMSDAPLQSVWVCSADCTPALIGDVRKGQVAAVHAGWRGTAQRILPETIARMTSNGSRIEDLRVAMGPAISGTVYQVERAVAAKVGATVLEIEDLSLPEPQFSEDAIIEALMLLPHPPVLPEEHPDRVRLDVRRINALQLERLGLEPEQVAIAPQCTFQEPERFFSYRRDRLKQVQWSGIVSKQSQ
jgi:polyphenol oxidase